MTEREFRSYQISGELPAEHWEALLKHLGFIGVQTQPDMPTSDAPMPEVEPYEGPLINRRDLIDFAVDHNIARTTAGRAWATLTRLYDYKVNPEKWSQYTWFVGSNFQYVPLVFNYAVVLNNQEKSIDREHLGDLQLDSLEALVAEVDRAIKLRGDKIIVKMLGDNTGPSVFGFLSKFAAEKRQQYEQS